MGQAGARQAAEPRKESTLPIDYAAAKQQLIDCKKSGDIDGWRMGLFGMLVATAFVYADVREQRIKDIAWTVVMSEAQVRERFRTVLRWAVEDNEIFARITP